MSTPPHKQILEWLDSVIEGLEGSASNIETQAEDAKPGFITTLTHAIPSDEPTALPTPAKAQTPISNTIISSVAAPTPLAPNLPQLPAIKRNTIASAVRFIRVLGFIFVLRIVHLRGIKSFNTSAAGSLSVSHVGISTANWATCSLLRDSALPADYDICNAAHRFRYITGRAPCDSKSQRSQQSITGE
ncbi:hypothetical protein J3459_008576 [Metarhizium acridum]|nr:hypothetical protein J3459_008576 [Metarhizium acridum]